MDENNVINTDVAITNEDNVVVSTNTSNQQLSVKSSAEDVSNVLDEVANEGSNSAEQAIEIDNTEQKTEESDSPKAEQSSEQQMANAHNALNSAEQDLANKGIDFVGLENEYLNNGSLSPESYGILEQAGYPKAVVDGVLAGWEAASTRFVNDVYAISGGQEEFARIQQFIGAQSPDVISAFNATLDTENLTQIRLAIEGIKGQMARAYGTQRPSIVGGVSPVFDNVGYETTAEMIKDMSNPRYQTDAKFTREVYRKVKNSKLF